LGFYFLAFLVKAYVPNALATKAKANSATIAEENSDTLVVDVGNAIALLVGIQSASIAAPLDMGV